MKHMKFRVLLVALFALVLLTSFAFAQADETTANYTINGSSITLSFEENQTSGHVWAISQMQNSILSLTDDKTENNVHSFTFDAHSKGEETVVFSFNQPHDPMNAPASVYTFTVSADENNALSVQAFKEQKNSTLNVLNIKMPEDDDQSALGTVFSASNTLTVLLKENASTGYVWSYNLSDETLRILEDVYVNDQKDGVNIVGAPGVHRFIFDANKQGDHTLSFNYGRSFEENSAYYTVDVLYSVDQNQIITLKEVSLKENGVLKSDKMMPEKPMQSNSASGNIRFKTPEFNLFIGHYANISTIASNRNISKKGYSYVSEDETIASVDAHGKVKALSEGTCTILVTSKADETVFARLKVNALVKAHKIAVSAPSKTVNIGETLQLSCQFDPQNTSNQQVTWHSSDKRYATVDQNGVVTGLKKGTITITATAKDGSKVRGSFKVSVLQSIKNAKMTRDIVRVGINYYVGNAVEFTPKYVSNRKVHWTSSDESIATVKDDNGKAHVTGHKWGQATISGVTEDGGHKVSFIVNVGSVRTAATIEKVVMSSKNLPMVYFYNNSPLNVTAVHIAVQATDLRGDPVKLSTSSKDPYTLYGTYNITMAPYTHHHMQHFKYSHFNSFDYTINFKVAVTGIETDTGYLDNHGKLVHKYILSEKSYKWVKGHTTKNEHVISR